MADDPQPSRLTGTTGGGVTGEIPARSTAGSRVAPTTANLFNVIRDPLIPVACWRMDDVRFDFASSFINPDSTEEFKLLQVLRTAHPGAPLSLFGHADPVGDDEFNKRLSGRRATAVFAVLLRDAARWERLFNNHEDKWGLRSLQVMLDKLGNAPGNTDGTPDAETDAAFGRFTPGGGNDPTTRQALYLAYMDAICQDLSGSPYRLTAADFLAGGADPDGRGDLQGCGEFNPVLMFSASENSAFASDPDKTDRNAENALNRRVTGLLFRPGSRIVTATWPCPAAEAPTAPCRTRFFADQATRRTFQAARRTNEADHNTFACRFFDILNDNSSCEGSARMVALQVFFQRFPGTGGTDAERGIANTQFTVRVIGGATTGPSLTPANGVVTINMPAGSTAVLEILGSEYVIQPLAALEAIAGLDGVKRRLQILGHSVGAVDNNATQDSDRCILEFQADSTPTIKVDGNIDPNTRTPIQTAVRNAGGE